MAYTFMEPLPVGLIITLISAAILRRKAPVKPMAAPAVTNHMNRTAGASVPTFRLLNRQTALNRGCMDEVDGHLTCYPVLHRPAAMRHL